MWQLRPVWSPSLEFTIKQKILSSAVVFFAGCLLSLGCSAAEQLYRNQPPVTPKLAVSGKWSVGVTTEDIVHPKQLSMTDFTTLEDRPLKLEIWYPATASDNIDRASYADVTRLGKTFELQGNSYRDATPVSNARFPLVVLSHGYTGYRTIMFYLAEHLASHGYVVVGIDHTHSTNREIDFATNPGSGFISTLLNRSRDQQFVLDHFASSSSTIAAITDTGRAAIIGYSMGGYGAINTVGGCYRYTEETLQQFGFPAALSGAMLPLFNTCNAGREHVDQRWKAMIAFAPWGQEFNVHQAESLQKIEIPTFYVVGDQDDISGYESGVRKLFEQTGSHHNYLLVYENARHNIAAHPSPQVAFATEEDIGHYFEPSWNTETLNRINQHMTLAFLNCHTMGQPSGCELLPQREAITQTKQVNGELSPPWPGFPARWGTGVKFFRGNAVSSVP